MVYENIENVISLLCTITGLIYSVFKYIDRPRRGYRYLVVFFLANFLSEYYWAIYELVMNDYPDVSGFAAYLGWNVGYLALLFAAFHMRHEEAKRIFHPVIFLPVLINVPQLVLYLQFGGVLNNLWEVGLTTLTMILCLQELVYYGKNREKRKAFPWFSLLVLLYLFVKYGMWTSSCFDWSRELLNPYHYCSFVDALLCVFFAYGAGKYYEAEAPVTETKSASGLRFQVLVQTIIALVVIGICAAGLFTAFWIKRSLASSTGLFQSERQLVIYLFAISAVLIILVLAMIYALTSRYRHTVEALRRMTEGKRSRLSFIATIVVTLALMVFAVVYNGVTLYRASVVSVYEDAEEKIKTTATELENYLTVAVTTLRVTADSVDLMERGGSSNQEITQFIMDQTERQAKQFDENFTGLYAYIDGEYLDGLGWEPPEGYEPTERDWYKAAVEANGKVVIVSPYVDAQTDSVVITIGRSISDAGSGTGPMQNVVCLDVIVNHIKEVIEAVQIAGKGYGMVVNEDGFIIAHRDNEYNGAYLSELYGPELLSGILGAENGRITEQIDGEDCTLFVSPVMDQWYAVIVIGNTELLEDTYSQLTISIMVSLITFCLISFFYYIGYKSEQLYGKKVEEMNIQVVTALATAIDAKDDYTNGHSTRVAEYARMIAARSGYAKTDQDEIYMMGLLHDVGKIGVPDGVINKPSKLTEEEFALIRKHPVIGNSILESIKERPKLATGARWHHERYGGGGYPDGIAGEQIPEEARIIAVADAYDAMTSRRSYRDVMPQDKVRSELENGMGTQFDPRFAAVMLRLIDEDKAFSMRET